MEMKYVVPDMAQSVGTLEFAGESEPVFERDKNNRRVLARRSYNLYSRRTERRKCCGRNSRAGWRKAFQV